MTAPKGKPKAAPKVVAPPVHRMLSLVTLTPVPVGAPTRVLDNRKVLAHTSQDFVFDLSIPAGRFMFSCAGGDFGGHCTITPYGGLSVATLGSLFFAPISPDVSFPSFPTGIFHAVGSPVDGLAVGGGHVALGPALFNQLKITVSNTFDTDAYVTLDVLADR